MGDGITLQVAKGVTAKVNKDGSVDLHVEAQDKSLFSPSKSGKRDIVTVQAILTNGMTFQGNLMAFAGYAKS